jgi:hypothetical protein
LHLNVFVAINDNFPESIMRYVVTNLFVT